MKQKNTQKIIIVKSKTRLEQLTAKFNTKGQADFYLKRQRDNLLEKQDFLSKKMRKSLASNYATMQTNVGSGEFKDFQEEHDAYHRSLERVQKICSQFLKVKTIESDFLPSYLFTAGDIVVVVGRDGLVANTAKYVNGLPIIGVNPDKQRNDGVLLRFDPQTLQKALEKVLRDSHERAFVTMAEEVLDDGQRLLAFNDFFIGPKTHTSARYQITYQGFTENHSSSGVIVATGAGSTGWLSSLFNMAAGIYQVFGQAVPLDRQTQGWETEQLIFVVREPFLSKMSHIDIPAGILQASEALILESLMPNDGMIFSDGITEDALQFNSGKIAKIGRASEKAHLVMP
ncbi:MAG: sugar kinase [Thermonemataceae bacterium]